MQYIYPCKPNPLAPNSKYFSELDNDKDWIAEAKRNGWRCLIERSDTLRLWTRHETLIKDTLFGIREALSQLPKNTMLDGELLFTRRVKGVPDALYIFDILVFDGEQITNKSLRDRKAILESIYPIVACDKITLAQGVTTCKKEFYHNALCNVLNEGIVIKKLDSIYYTSQTKNLQNPFWLKVKEHL